MRTTVDLPDELMREVKARAAQRGETLKQMFTRLLSAEVSAPDRATPGARVSLPLVGDPGGPPADVTNVDVETALADDDAQTYRP